MQLNQFQSHFSISPMIFDDQSDQYLEYQQSIEGSELGLISLPMTKYTKSSLDGMIHLPITALPDSNPFGPYLSPAYDSGFSGPGLIVNPDSEPEYQSDSDFNYPAENAYQHNGYPTGANHVEYATLPKVSSNNAQMSRKRKASPDQKSLEQQQPTKKTIVARLQAQVSRPEFHEVDDQSSLYPGYNTAAANPVYVNTPVQINSPRQGHHYSTSSASQISLAAPSPHTPAWSPSFTTVKTEQSPRPPMTPAPRPASTSSPYTQGQVKLVRTSTIPQQSSPGIGPAMSAAHPQPFNPYGMYSQHKATLRLNGDLDAVALKWTEVELEARRKLIVFNRSQTGSTIDADFKTVSPAEWSRNDITINCIWWKEKKEAFVTSVDTIALLEQLIAVRFTVEEKNRIRRNLEGFRPLTVSKAKADSEDFFKVIMGFPNPKPRNIEKDVKVFPWKILAHALKKIISKYSASYSSTSALITPAASVYARHDTPAEYPCEVPQSHTLMSNVPPTCSMSMPPYEHGVIGSNMPGRELTLQVPSMPAQYEIMPQALMYGPGTMPMAMPMSLQMPMASHPHQMAPHSAGPARNMAPTWSYGPGVPDATRYMMAYSAPPSAHPHGPIETASLNHAAGYPLSNR